MSGLSKSVARFYVRFSVFTMDAAHSSNMRLHQSRHLEFSCSWTIQVPHLIGYIWAKLVSAESIWEASTTRLHVDLHFWWDMRHGCFHFCKSIPVISYVWPPQENSGTQLRVWKVWTWTAWDVLILPSCFPLLLPAPLALFSSIQSSKTHPLVTVWIFCCFLEKRNPG